MKKTAISTTGGIAALLFLTCPANAQFQSEAQDEAAVTAANAAAVTAQGQYNYNAAAAAVQLETARGEAMENTNRGLREWYARKQLNADYLATKSGSTPGLLNRLAEIKRPDRLTLGQYSRQAGKLNWPASLKDPIFDDERLALDEAFAQRQAFDAGTDSGFYQLVDELCKKMHKKLVESIDQMSTTDSISARKFLRSVEYEAKILPGDLGGLAVNRQ
jgi:hypothetical protein